MNKRFYIENLGCAKNQVDAEVITYQLEKAGYRYCETADEAQIIIINTCGFIESAKQESIDVFFALRKKYPKAKIVLCGCLAQRYADDLKTELPEADAIFGNRDLSKIVSLVDLQTKFLVPEYPDVSAECDTRDRLFNYLGSAYLKVSEGCNHWCSYCSIPVIRGSLRSRPMDAILTEAKRLISSGIKEINLIAQDLAAYGYDWDCKSHFCELLNQLCMLSEDFKIRMLYIHPDWITDEIIQTVKQNPKILHYFDIPFQHADPKILKSMKRTGNLETYTQLIEYIRAEIPDAVIRTTLMLGFPNDSEDCFQTLKTFVKQCKFNWMGSFVYSREEDTRAYDMTDEETHKLLSEKAAKWKKQLDNIQEKITEDSLNQFVGNTYKVLIEENVKGEDLAIGRIYAQAPEVDGVTVVMGRNMVPGNVYDCVIRKVNGIHLDAIKIETL